MVQKRTSTRVGGGLRQGRPGCMLGSSKAFALPLSLPRPHVEDEATSGPASCNQLVTAEGRVKQLAGLMRCPSPPWQMSGNLGNGGGR